MTFESDDVTKLQKRKRLFFVWAIAATLAAIVFVNTTLFLFVRLRAVTEDASFHQRADAPRSSVPRGPRPRVESSPEAAAPTYPMRGTPLTRPLNATFTNLVEAEVAGRYRFFEESGEVGVITLMPDHTTVNKEGITIRQYRWELQPDGIMTHWRRFNILFNDIEAPGVYVARRENGLEYSRLEKVQP